MKGQARINSKHSVIRFLALIFGVFEVLVCPRSPSLKPDKVLGAGQGRAGQDPSSQGLFCPPSTRPRWQTDQAGQPAGAGLSVAWQSLFRVGTAMLWGGNRVLRSSPAAGESCRGAAAALSCMPSDFLTLFSHPQVGLLLEGLKHPLESSQSRWHRWTESIRK